VEITAHNAHALAVAPVQLATFLFEMELLGRKRRALRDNRYAIAALEIASLDRAVITVRNAHVGPIDVPGLCIDRDAIRDPAIGHQNFLVRSIAPDRKDASVASVEHIQAAVLCAICLRGHVEFSLMDGRFAETPAWLVFHR